MDRRHPSPIEIPQHGESAGLFSGTSHNSSYASSPRAALVAGLRSATDRRKRALDANSPALLASSPRSPSYGFFDHHQQSPLQQQQQQQYIPPSPTYAALYAKQQELLATSLLIQQQQQRIQAAMNNVIYEGGGMPMLLDGGYGNGGYNNARRPSSPSLPTRPQSSVSFRSRLFPDANGRGSLQVLNSPGFNNDDNSSAGANNINYNNINGSPQPFRKGHRKSSSLGMAVINNNNNNNNMDSPHVNGSPYISRSRNMNYEIPNRQPRGPPTLEEVAGRPGVNFASRI